jgi:adenosine deaminase
LDIREIIKSIPKAEIHCHIDGSIRQGTIRSLAEESGICIPSETSFKVSGKCGSLNEYLDKFYFPIRVMQTSENIKRIVLELLEDAKKDGIQYIEMRFAPMHHTNLNLSPDEAVQAVLEAMKAGKSKFNIFSGLILCCMRNEPARKSIEVIKLAEKYKKEGVVAVDLAGNESDFPPELHKKAFDMAYDFGLKITVHAGETGICENILESIRLLHADRIGHGVYAYKDRYTMDYLIQNQIPLEMCPMSNLNTGIVNSYEEHPIKRYFDEGVNITLNTDNRTVSDVTLTDEYVSLITKQLFTLDEVVRVIKNGIRSSFAPEDVKKNIMESIKNKA